MYISDNIYFYYNYYVNYVFQDIIIYFADYLHECIMRGHLITQCKRYILPIKANNNLVCNTGDKYLLYSISHRRPSVIYIINVGE